MVKRILVVLSAAAFILYANSVFAQEGRGQARQVKPQDKVQSRVDQLTTQLNLTAEQQVKVKDIFTAELKQIQDLRQSSGNMSWQELKPKTKEIRTEANKKILDILTPEQKEEYKQLRQQRQATASPESQE
jgi:Spy/CpxP family protein refolding chaperone